MALQRILFVCAMWWLAAGPATAQVVDEAKYYSCLRQTGGSIRPYDMVDENGAAGGYRFSVNSLFQAGLCQKGTAPHYVSYNWALCDFKGPAALANNIRSINGVLQRPDIQDRIVQAIITRKSLENRQMMLDSRMGPIQRFGNGPDLLGGLLYRKGRAATRLLLATDINSADRLAYTTRDYIQFYGMCAGNNQVSRERRLFDDKAPQHDTVPPGPVPMASVPWQWLNDMPAPVKGKVLDKVPEWRLVFGTADKHRFAMVTLPSAPQPAVLVRLAGSDFCSSRACTYYLFRNDVQDVIIFYAGDVRLAPGLDGFYIDGFYKSVGEIGK